MGRGTLFVVSAPSGAGKSSLIRRLLERDASLGFSVSHTTRPPRPGERDGVEYHFVDRPAFEAMVGRGEFAEWAEVHGNLYGTSFAALEAETGRGRDVVLDIDVQGALQIRERIPGAVLVFVLPPSWGELRRRLQGRGQDAEEVIARRLANARDEVARARQYRYLVVNDDLDRAADDLAAIVRAERCRTDRRLRELDALAQEAGAPAEDHPGPPGPAHG